MTPGFWLVVGIFAIGAAWPILCAYDRLSARLFGRRADVRERRASSLPAGLGEPARADVEAGMREGA